MLKFGFGNIVCSDFAKKYFLSLLKGNIPQSIIITGEEGVGKLLAAEQFVLAALCHNRTEDGACGKCPSCEKYRNRQNFNVAYWYPRGMNTTIDQMRHLKEVSYYTPTDSPYKFNIIQRGDTLNEESSNSILKIIEEPPSYLVNIILYNNPHNILPTIRSRSIEIRLMPAKKEEIYSKLMQDYSLSSDMCEFISSFSLGSYGRAKRFAENEKRDVCRKIVFDTLFAVFEKPWELLCIADLICDKNNYFSEKGKMTADEAKQSERDFFLYPVYCEMTQSEAVFYIIDLISLLLRDMLSFLCGSGEYIVNKDRAEDIAFLAKKTSEEKITETIKILWETKSKIRANVNTGVAVSAMLCRALVTLKGK